ncbi:dethiobiotin synthase [Bacillus sp. BGMRC 2118]|nr:dethiobiotin synthase [Bacillus sp. BGMRC 2118]
MTSFWITGTDTDVGKTIVTTYMMRYFQSKGSTIPYKPVQSGITEYASDTKFYQSFSEIKLEEEHVNSYSFIEPASPHYAARLEQTVIEENKILDKIKHLQSIYEHVICEGAGGLFVPLNVEKSYHLLDLIQQSSLPVIVVARSTLGTINHTLLSIEALKARNISILGIVFNGYDGSSLEDDNITTIQQLTNLPFLVIPKLQNLSDLKELQIENTEEFFERLVKV